MPESIRDEIGDGAKRARIFGARHPVFTVAEAANLAGVAYSTAYYWHRHGVFSPTGDLGARFQHPAQRCYTGKDVFVLAVLREARSHDSGQASQKRGRRNRWLGRIAKVVRTALEGGRDVRREEPYLRAVLVATESTADICNGNQAICSAIDRIRPPAGAPKSAVVIDLFAVWCGLPEAATWD